MPLSGSPRMLTVMTAGKVSTSATARKIQLARNLATIACQVATGSVSSSSIVPERRRNQRGLRRGAQHRAEALALSCSRELRQEIEREDAAGEAGYPVGEPPERLQDAGVVPRHRLADGRAHDERRRRAEDADGNA